jgi:hypothetical protein
MASTLMAMGSDVDPMRPDGSRNQLGTRGGSTMDLGFNIGTGVREQFLRDQSPFKRPVIDAEHWQPGRPPVRVQPSERPNGCVRWLRVNVAPSQACEVAPSQACEVFAILAPTCPGLTLRMVDDLLTPDQEPRGKTYADGRSDWLHRAGSTPGDAHGARRTRRTDGRATSA